MNDQKLIRQMGSIYEYLECLEKSLKDGWKVKAIYADQYFSWALVVRG